MKAGNSIAESTDEYSDAETLQTSEETASSHSLNAGIITDDRNHIDTITNTNIESKSLLEFYSAEKQELIGGTFQTAFSHDAGQNPVIVNTGSKTKLHKVNLVNSFKESINVKGPVYSYSVANDKKVRILGAEKSQPDQDLDSRKMLSKREALIITVRPISHQRYSIDLNGNRRTSCSNNADIAGINMELERVTYSFIRCEIYFYIHVCLYIRVSVSLLTLVLLNKLRCHAHL